MRKNILTFVLSFSFLFCGMLITNVEASNGSMPNINQIQNLANKSIRTSELINKFNANLSKIKKVCAVNDCDFMIQISADAFDAMIVACNYNEMSSECANAQTWIEIVMEATLDVCSQAKVLQEREFFLALDGAKRLKETKA
jgi:hypothetical protein